MDVIFKIFRQEGKIVLSIVFLFVVAALIEIWLLFVPSSLEKVADQTIAERQSEGTTEQDSKTKTDADDAKKPT